MNAFQDLAPAAGPAGGLFDDLVAGGGEAPIDTSRPALRNADGSYSTEQTITIEQDGRFFNVPTIVGGRRRTEDEAVQLFRAGRNPAVGDFASLDQAERAAVARSERIGRVRGTAGGSFDDLIPQDRQASVAERGEGVMYDGAPGVRTALGDRLSQKFDRVGPDEISRRPTGTIGPVPGQVPTPRNLAADLARTLPSSGEQIRQGTRAAFADLVGSEDMRRDALRRGAQARLEDATNAPAIEDPTLAGVYSGVKSAVQTAPTIAGMIANPALGLAALAGQVGLPKYGEYREGGATPAKAAVAAAGQAGIEVATELAPMGFLVKQFGRIGAGRYVAGLLAREIPGETAATIGQNAIDAAMSQDPQAWQQYRESLPADVYQTVVATLVQSGLYGGANAAARSFAERADRPAGLPGSGGSLDTALGGRATAVEPAVRRAPQPAASAESADAPELSSAERIGVTPVVSPAEVLAATDAELLRRIGLANPDAAPAQSSSPESIPTQGAATPSLPTEAPSEALQPTELDPTRSPAQVVSGAHDAFVDLVPEPGAPVPAATPAPEVTAESRQTTQDANAPSAIESTSPAAGTPAELAHAAPATPETALDMRRVPSTQQEPADVPTPLATTQLPTEDARLRAGTRDAGPSGGDPILQNRDRSSAESIRQMQSIAAAPDAARLSFSRTLADGAPVVVIGGDAAVIPPAQLGRADIAIDSEGRRVPVRYAVVGADQITPSHRADGTRVPAYEDAAGGRIRAINNGRVAGLQQAYQQGTAQPYQQGLGADAELTGVNAAAIAGVPNPVLVRVMSERDVTADLGARSNARTAADLSITDQARTDAARVDVGGFEYTPDGRPTDATLTAFIEGLPAAERAALRDAKGRPNSRAEDRLQATAFWRGYGDENLLRLAAEARDPEARVVMAALAQAAGDMARLDGVGDYDVRPIVRDAARAAVNATRRGISLARAAEQTDLDLDSRATDVLRFFAANARSAKRIAAGLQRLATAAYTESTRADDMFGSGRRTAQEVVDEALRQDQVADASGPEGLEQRGGRPGVQRDVERGADRGSGQAGAAAADDRNDGADAQGVAPRLREPAPDAGPPLLKIPFSSAPVPLDSDKAWKGLSVPTREMLRQRLQDIAVVNGKPVYRRGSAAGGEAWAAAVERADNPLRAAVQRWGGQQLMDVLRLAGLPMEQLRTAVSTAAPAPPTALQDEVRWLRDRMDRRAHEAASSPLNGHAEPTQAQKDAGNYRKGHVRIAGLDISIENPQGSERSGTDRSGKPWSVTMQHHYGYIRGTVGRDKDHIDVFVKPGTPEDWAGEVYVVDQVDPSTRRFDEHKVMIGFDSLGEAEAAYRSNYSADWQGMRSIRATSVDGFRRWIEKGDTRRPFAESAKAEAAADVQRPSGLAAEIAALRERSARSPTSAPVEDLGEHQDRNEAYDPVAARERAVYRVSEPDPIQRDLFDTTGDLFDEDLSQASRATAGGGQAAAGGGDVQPTVALSVRQAPEVPGLYRVSTQLVAVGERRLPVERIRNEQDAATAFAYLTGYAVEHVDALVTDAGGVPLAIIGSFKGAPDQASVYPSTLAGELSRIDGAAHLWISHNHPSGTPNLSGADQRLSDVIANTVRGTGVEFHGVMATAKRGDVVRYSNRDGHIGDVDTSQPARYSVPIVDRMIVRSDPGDAVTAPHIAKEQTRRIAGSQPGIVFLTNQNEIAAFVPFEPADMLPLRQDGRLMRLFRAASQSGAGAAIVAMPDGRVTRAQYANVKGALGTIDVRVLDGIEYDSARQTEPATSLAERGLDDSAGAAFQSLGDSAPATRSADTKQASAPKQRAEVPPRRAPTPSRLADAYRAWEDGRIGDDQMLDAVRTEIDRRRARGERAQARVRGTEWLRERLTRARRTGELLEEEVDLALWLLERAPQLGTNLGLSIREGGDDSPNGTYDVLARVVTIFSSQSDQNTATHEILHHAERMLPPDVQTAVREERLRQLRPEVAAARRELEAAAARDPETDDAKLAADKRAMLDWFLEAAEAGDDSLALTVWKGVGSRTLRGTLGYQYAAASEFWAINGARLLRERHEATGWAEKARQWLRELVAKVRALFKLPSDAAVLRGLEAVMKGDGSFVSAAMISDLGGALNDVTDPPAGERAENPIQRWDIPPESALHTVQRRMQDYLYRLKAVQDAISEQGGTVGVPQDAYRAEERLHGRIQAQLDDFKTEQMRPLMRKLADAGLTPDDLALFAYARHAPERNAHIAQANPTLEGNGSGMTNAQAETVLERFRRDGQYDALKGAHDDLLAITRRTRRVLVDAGLISRQQYERWESMYREYVPLRGFEAVEFDDDGAVRFRKPGGIDIRGDESKPAEGRTSRAGRIIENIILDHERAVVRAERNAVGKVFLDLVTTNPDLSLWEVDASRTQPADLNDRQLALFDVEQAARVPATIDRGEETIGVKVGGQNVYIKVRDKLLARALRRAYLDETGDLQRIIAENIGWYTNWIRNTVTRYNPVFVAVNTVRDVQTGALSTLDELGVEGVGRYARHYAGAMAAALRHEREKLDPEHREWDRWYREYKQAGAITGGFFMRDASDVFDELRAEILEAGGTVTPRGEGMGAVIDRAYLAVRGTQAGRLGAATLRTIEMLGSVSENAARLAAYRSAREMGKGVAEAASIAKNLTTNFNRKGELGTAMNSLYLFYNASVQGSARTFQALRSPRVQAAVAGMTALGFALALGNAQWGGADDDGEPNWDKLPDWEKERNLIIMLPPALDVPGVNDHAGKAKYLKIPLPYGFNVFPVLGYALADGLRNARDPRHGKSALKAGILLTSTLADAFNPVGGGFDPTDPVQLGLAAAPTFLDLPIQLATESNGFGRMAVPPRSAWDQRPDSERFFLSDAGTTQQRIARWLNSASGGDRARSGWIDVAPGTIETAVRGATGGVGTFVTDTFSTLSQFSDASESVSPRNVPFLRQFYGQADNRWDQAAFYENRREIETRYKQNLMAAKMGIAVDFNDPENAAVQRMGEHMVMVNRYLSQLRKQEMQVVEDPKLTDSERRLKREAIDLQRTALMRQFNAALGEAFKSARSIR